ncbi:hypothetical protein FRC03_001783 [Tulasnella sp. 419]|nr:hypothetical protein FRC03_001783 [Tulasnella sp. 419]
MDRAYRFGQRRDVSVYRFLGAGSLEELVYARQLYKQQQMKIGYDASHQTRLFAGIQGDSERQGELFGLKNMFALRTDLATKEQIEDAHLQNLEWALANKEVGRDQSDIQDSKSLAEFVLQDEEGGLKLASKPAIPLDSVEAIFAERGMFTHVNDHVLRENYVEAQKAQEAVKNVKQRGLRRSRTSLSHSKAIEGERAFNIHTASHKSSEKVGASKLMPWPPVRAHHKTTKPRTYTPEERQVLAMRRKALFKLGVVTDEQGYLDYASRFSHLSVEEQQMELERLDAQHPS